MSTNTSAVRHIVMWKVAGSTADEKKEAIVAVCREFEGLRGKIPGMTLLEVGVDISRASYACDVVLVTEFESEDALKSYASHPEHFAVRDRLEGLRVARHQVDYPIAPQKVV